MSVTVTQLFNEAYRIDSLHPKSRSGEHEELAWYSMRDYHKAHVIVDVGSIAANGTVDVHMHQATDDAGSGSKAISGKALTQLGDTDDNNLYVINMDTSEMDVTNNFDYIAVELDCGGNAACLTNVILLRGQTRFAAVDDSNLGEVIE